MPSAGDPIGPYTLERLLRSRGSAEVWIARAATGEQVALSTSPLGHKNEEDARRLLEENLKIAKLVRHPNMAEVVGGGHSGDLRYIASDVADFIDLGRVFQVARTHNFWPSPGTAGFITRQIARALEYVHALTRPDGLPLYLVHRDVAPHSVLIDRTGMVKLSEFVGAIESQALIKTAGKDQSGHVAYLSPEVASYGRADARSDVFALGTVLWELITKKPLFLRTTDLETIEAVRTAEVPSIPPDVPAELALIAQSCLRKTPKDRPMSHELAQQLDAAIARLPGADPQSVALLFQRVSDASTSERPRTALLSGSNGHSAAPKPASSPPPPPSPRTQPTDPFFDPSRDGPAWEGKRFHVLGKLGSGGMGEVYRVRDRELDEVVALKLIPRESTTELRSTERLKREVRLARKISSPYVCRIFDIVDLGEGTRGLTMALVEGTTLAEMMRNGVPVDYRRFARWGADIAEGLAAAHEIQVIHRDLKPENVMIRADNRAVILDFGIAFSEESAIYESIKLTQQGMIMGTPLYMSPEQLLNLPLDARSDLFALGLMLAELVTGEVPMRGSSYPELVEKRVTKVVPYHLNDMDPAVPKQLAEVVDDLLKIAAPDRPVDGREVARRLREIAEESGATRLPTSGPSVPPLPRATPRTAPLSGPTDPAASPANTPPLPLPAQSPPRPASTIALGLSATAAAIIVLSVLFTRFDANGNDSDPLPVYEDAAVGVVVDAGVAPIVAPADAGVVETVKRDAGVKKTIIPPAEEM